MKNINLIYIAFMAVGILFTSCEKDDIVRFNAESGINFLEIDGAYSTQYSFISNPEDEYIQEIPVQILGDTTAFDRSFEVEIVNDTVTTAEPDQFEILDGVVPAGQFEGILTVKLKKFEALDNKTVTVKLRLSESPEFQVGNVESSEFVISWTNQVIVPTWSVYYRTFFTSVGSTAAFRIFIQTTGLTQFTRTEYAELGAAGVEALATKFGDYIMQYNEDHKNDPDPTKRVLLHDDGPAEGEPIIPIYYTRSKFN